MNGFNPAYLDSNLYQNSMLMSALKGLGGGVNPLLSAGGAALGALGGLVDTAEKKHSRWQMGQQKDLYNKFRWGGNMDRDVVSPQMLGLMQGRTNQAMQPMLARLMWGASRNAGMSSPQTYNMFSQNAIPTMAGLFNQNQKWATGMNVQNRQMIAQLLARLAGA